VISWKSETDYYRCPHDFLSLEEVGNLFSRRYKFPETLRDGEESK